MNDKIVFDRYYCINSAKTKEIIVHYILQAYLIFMRIKACIPKFIMGGIQILIISMFLRGALYRA